jgi:hypothetical protein
MEVDNQALYYADGRRTYVNTEQPTAQIFVIDV